MRKNMIKVAFVAAIAMACGINMFNTQKSETLSEIALANVEALADKTVVTECGGCSTEFPGKKCCTLTLNGKQFTLYYENL